MTMSVNTNLALVAAIQSERRTFASARRLARRMTVELDVDRADDFRRAGASDS